MKKIQESAKSVQKAIEQGLKNLGVALEDVDVKILDEGGLFRKAKVELIYDDGVEEVTVQDNNEADVEKSKVKKESKKAEKESLKADKKALKNEKKMSKEEIKAEDNSEQTLESLCTKFLKELCVKMNIEAQISFEKKEDGVMFNATGEKVGPLIGKRGETLNAIQEILTNVAKKAGYRDEKVFFDVENYKTRRELSLVGLAERMAKKAIKIEKPIRLERMNSYERKIIHTALQDFEGVSTRSEGEDPNRYLVIIPNKRSERFKENIIIEPKTTHLEEKEVFEKKEIIEEKETMKTESIVSDEVSVKEENIENEQDPLSDENAIDEEKLVTEESIAKDESLENEEIEDNK